VNEKIASRYIVWFSEINRNLRLLVGGKGLNLGLMYNSELPVPGGFVVTSYAFKHYIEVTGLYKKIFGMLKKLNVNDNKKLQEAAVWIQKQIVNTPIPSAILEEIFEAYSEMEVNGSKVEDLIKAGDGALVAVRSSGNFEDGANVSFAGQHSSFMNVKGKKELVAYVLVCWASLFSSRAIYYRAKNKLSHENALIAVVVQKMVNADIAGVAFSANVVTNDTSEILIEGSYGLGEAVVSGELTPDEFILDKKTLDVKSRNIADKTWMYVKDSKTLKNVKKDVPKSLRDEACLKENEIRKLAELIVKIEKFYGKPQDIEFAIEKGKIYVVQSRPITTLKKE
jgi:pyruvate,water dikinase